MGLLNPGKETDIRAVRKAQKSMEVAERYVLARNLDAAISELTKARDALLGAAVEPAQQGILVEALVRLSKDYLDCGMALDAANSADLALKSAPTDLPALLAYARALVKKGEFPQAISTLDKATLLPGSDTSVWLFKADLYEHERRQDMVMFCLKKANELDPSDLSILDRMIQRSDDKASLLKRKADLLVSQERYEEALTAIDQAVTLMPRNVEMMLRKGEILTLLKRTDQALLIYDDVLARDSGNALAHLYKARGYKDKGDKAAALAQYKESLRNDGMNKFTWAEVAALLFEMDRLEESSTAYDRALAIDPELIVAINGKLQVAKKRGMDEDIALYSGKLLGRKMEDRSVFLERIDSLSQLGRFEEASEAVNLALKRYQLDEELMARKRKIMLQTGNMEEVISLAEAKLAKEKDDFQALMDLGSAYMRSTRYRDALRPLEKAAKVQPSNEAPLICIKESYKHIGKDKDVLDSCDRILKVNSVNEGALFDKAVALDRMNRKDDAVALYEQVMALDPDDKDNLKDLSSALYSMGRFEESLARSTLGTQMYPNQVAFWRVQGDSNFALKRYADAVTSFTNAVKLSPGEKHLIYSRGLALENAKRYEEAVAAYDEALAIDPKDNSMWLSKGVALEWLQRYPQALDCYEEAVRLESDNKFVLVRIGQVLAKMNDHEAAIRSFDKALEKAPKDIELLEMKKVSLKHTDRLEELVKVCQRIIKLDGKNRNAYVDMGVASHRLSDFDDAIDSFDTALGIDPGNITILHYKKTSVVAKGIPEQIIDVCDSILKVDPSDKPALMDKAFALERLGRLAEANDTYTMALAVDDQDKELHNRKGLVLIGLGRYADAVVEFDRSFALDSSDLMPLDNKGRAYLLMREYDHALKVFDQCVVGQPGNPRFQSDRGRALASLGNLAEAVDAFDASLALDKGDSQTWKYKGNVMFKLGQFQDCVICLNRALELGAEEQGIYKAKGRALEELKHYSDALESFLRAVALDASDASAWERIAVIRLQMDDPANAYEAIKKALACDPKNRRMIMEKGDICQKLQRPEEAIKSFDAAIALDPSDPFAYFGQGVSYLKLRRYVEAQSSLRKALELNPNFDQARESLRSAEQKLHEIEVVNQATSVLECEYRQNRRMSKEEMFKECGIPYNSLDEVTAFLDVRETVNVELMNDADLDQYEEDSRYVLMAAARNPRVKETGLGLSDVMMALPGKDIVRAKKVLSYVEKVNKMDLSHHIMDARTEKLLRTAMNLPEEKRNVMGIIETLGVGIYTARRLMSVIKTLRANEPKPAPVEAAEEALLRPKQRPANPKEWVESEEPIALPEQRPRRARPEPKTTPAVEYQVESGVPVMEKKPSREPIMFGDEQKDLYQTFYKQEKRPAKVDSLEVAGRRCLFHGEAAVTACSKCSSLLCEECVRGGLCPRCHAPIEGAAVKTKKAAPAVKKDPRAILEESEGLEPQAAQESDDDRQSKDWSRL
ncbi:MAG TPA: tetratricopeptide repeat protein [Methanomassiliicoccales archaeon]|jgi:tetratricopeptide (TPR) repeat protein